MGEAVKAPEGTRDREEELRLRGSPGRRIRRRGKSGALRRSAGVVGYVPRGARALVSVIRGGKDQREESGKERPGSVGLHIGGGVAAITLRRPEKRNAISQEMWDSLLEKVRRVSTDGSVRVLVIRGAGEDFSAGADLREMGSVELSEAEKIFHKMEECVSSIEECPFPTIASLKGYALGTGLEVALACDLRIAQEGARLGMPVARLGITLSRAFVERLTSLIGPSRTKELVYTGRMLDAREALEWGLVNRVVPEEESALHEAFELARTIRAQSPASLLAVKARAGSASGREPAAYGYVDPEDFPEGVKAFLEKRAPRFG